MTPLEEDPAGRRRSPPARQEAACKWSGSFTVPNDWKQLSNGALLDRIVAGGFNVLITNDKNMSRQQTLGSRLLAVLVLPTNRLPDVLAMAPQIVRALNNFEAGRFTNVGASADDEPGAT